MFRFPACRRQTGAAVLSFACGERTRNLQGSRMNAFRRCSTVSADHYTKTRATTENRLTKWCRRLWGLANESGHLTAGTTVAEAAAAINRLASANAAAAAARHQQPSLTRGTGKPDPAWAADAAAHPHINGWIASRDLNTLKPEELIHGLREVVAADANRLPTVLVETIWEVFNAILPPEVQRDLKHALTPEKLNHFFSFVSLLTEMDFDVGAVKQAAERLNRAVAEYEAAVASLHNDAAGSTTTAPNINPNGDLTVAQLEKQASLSEGLTHAKNAVVAACFKARNAGSPLYYTWLRHTASLEGGIRRLMDFRKTVHFFDVECKKRIKALRSQLTQEQGTRAETTASPAELELHFWLKRERDIQVLDASLTFLFHDFFSKEYLIMEELSWFSTPPSMLEQIMSAEAVHPFTKGLQDMRERLQPTHHRHLFAFLHPAVVEEPLIAVQVALTKGISGSVDYILGRPTPLADPENDTVHGRAFQKHLVKYGPDTLDKERVDTAIFYSINSAQSALRGMDMGNMLIKRVVREIEENINASRSTRKLTPITQFSTLSPVPGYTRWLSGEVERLNHYAHLETREEKTLIDPQHTRVFGECPSAQELEDTYYRPVREAVLGFVTRHEMSDEEESIGRLKAALEQKDLVLANAQAMKFLIRQFLAPDIDSPWWLDHAFTKALERPLLRSVAHYLYKEKKKRNNHILDPVGNFHVSNGATIFRVNYLGNATAQGSRESGCVMVNYWYNTHTIGHNVAMYERDKTVAADRFILDLLKNKSDS